MQNQVPTCVKSSESLEELRRKEFEKRPRQANSPIQSEPGDPLVSVVVTCYNYGHYLSECLASILGQTYRNLELILIDDGSTDNTGEIAAHWSRDPRLKYVRQENQGQASAKNHGIRLCRGKFIAFLDSDDRWNIRKLERQMPRFDDPEVGVVFCRALQMDEHSCEFAVPIRLEGFLTPREGKVTHELIYDNFVPYGSAVVRRECFDRVGLFDEGLEMGIDWDLWLRISLYYQFSHVDEQLFHYRIGHAGQMSNRTEVRMQCANRIMQRFLSLHPDALDAATARNARSYAFENRGRYFEARDKRAAAGFYLRALFLTPFHSRGYKGLVRTALPKRALRRISER